MKGMGFMTRKTIDVKVFEHPKNDSKFEYKYILLDLPKFIANNAASFKNGLNLLGTKDAFDEMQQS